MNLPFISEKPLYRNSENGKILGVCAGIADYAGVPANLVRLVAILSTFGFFFVTILVYIALGFILDKKPQSSRQDQATLSIDEILQQADQTLKESEQRLQKMEGYVTSETFSVRSRFRKL
ncbi:envelope stress response membrane protein PspC [Rosenbergiella australiborealis]|uniref:Envelope stress response membrane protein PspC n=1 Tax=Rosenbergiella australiborealis TaxID=1544696 RepID=A0ABS5T220_9GAMM|nr:envelope stress response membrane protein PspC [Rosenbergiella australiborealis]MBT0726383.1 envelope stress response membrane protein PspC [Rosenbergiella australiborealis]